nr:hypothetical protein [Tanacetum cinerariifolium]
REVVAHVIGRARHGQVVVLKRAVPQNFLVPIGRARKAGIGWEDRAGRNVGDVLPVLVGVGHLHQVGGRLKAGRAAVAQHRLAHGPFFGGHDNDAVGPAHPVDGGGRG